MDTVGNVDIKALRNKNKFKQRKIASSGGRIGDLLHSSQMPGADECIHRALKSPSLTGNAKLGKMGEHQTEMVEAIYFLPSPRKTLMPQ